VAIAYPPPKVDVDPTRLVFETLGAGRELYRIYDPKSKYKTGPRTFRSNGPRLRFDHQRGKPGPKRTTVPVDDPDRRIYYAALSLEGAVVEVFGDSPRIISRGTYRSVRSRLTRALTVLDLRGRGGMVAGPTAGISGTETRRLSQAWARYFYERTNIYGNIDGLLYSNSHNQLDALALFERAEPVIMTASQKITRLISSMVELELYRIAERNDLRVED
jgi:RES domain-containing protein